MQNHNAAQNVIWLDIPGCAKESEGVQYNVKKTKCYNHSWIKNKKGYTPIFLCFTDKIKQGHVRCKKYYTPWIKRLVLSVYDKYYIFLFKLTSYKIQDYLMIQINVRKTRLYYSQKNTIQIVNVGSQRSSIPIPLIYSFHTTDSVF